VKGFSVCICTLRYKYGMNTARGRERMKESGKEGHAFVMQCMLIIWLLCLPCLHVPGIVRYLTRPCYDTILSQM
jgi:hypothetical protein